MIRSLALSVLFAAPAVADEARWLAEDSVGSWTSAAQATSPEYDWVESEVVRIWPDREDGVWLYQENAIMASGPDLAPSADAKDRPYFQVVVRLQTSGPGEVLTTTHKIADRAAARGAWRNPDLFDPAWLGEPSCAGKVERVSRGWWRGEAECANAYKGAVKVVSLSVRSPDAHVNWDRGFDAEGALVWGPPGGGYQFQRKEAAE